jgi:hypothetical protein
MARKRRSSRRRRARENPVIGLAAPLALGAVALAGLGAVLHHRRTRGLGSIFPVDPYQLGKNAGQGIASGGVQPGGTPANVAATNLTPWIIGGIIVAGVAGYAAYRIYFPEVHAALKKKRLRS